MADTINNIFDSTLSPREVTSYTLSRGVTDFTNLQQFDMYETGYSFLINLSIPKFLKNACNQNDEYKKLIQNYCHIIEYDFRGCQGIGDITSNPAEVSNGLDSIQVITSTKEDSGTQFSMSYFERSGSIITKTHELFLRGIKDPRTQMKRYLGQITGARSSTTSSTTGTTTTEASFANEVFNYMLIVTDNTGFNIERSYILAACQPTTAQTSIYQVEKGQIQFQEISISMNGFPIVGRIVNSKAKTMLEYINKYTCFDEMEFGYNVLSKDNSDIESLGGQLTQSPVFNSSSSTDSIGYKNDTSIDSSQHTGRTY